MRRLKSPAYGKRLIEERRAGTHQLEVSLVYGDKWFDIEYPKICLKPDEFEPGKYDFHSVAGLKVIVIDQLGGSAELVDNVLPPTFGKFYDLLAEVAQFAAIVGVKYPTQWKWPDQDVQDLATGARWYDREQKSMQWPRWWNDELQRAYEGRLDGWLNDCASVREYIERERGRAA